MRRLSLAMVLVAAGAVAKEPMPAQCATDAECVITDFSGCCGGCCPSVRAMSKQELERQQARCAAVDCAERMCAAVVCEPAEPASSLRAVCESGKCVARPRASECKTDRDCAVVHPPVMRGSCQCPGEPRAVPASQAEREKSDKQTFGLSQGKSCPPCAEKKSANARCEQSRCVVR